jgi:hypothetical protein
VRLALLGLGLMLVAAAAPGSALASPTWLSPVGLSNPDYNGEEAEVGIDKAGDTIAVWVHFDGSNEIIQAAERPAGGTWGSPVDLSAPGEDAADPRLAVGAAGDAVAVWRRYDGANTRIEAASLTPGGTWGAPVKLSAGGENAGFAGVAVDSAGDAAAVWQRFDGVNPIIQASTRSAGGVWQAPVDLSEAGENAFFPQVAVDPAGDAVAVWERYDGADFITQAASRPAEGSWEAPVNLSAPGQNGAEPQVALDSAGDAVVVWDRYGSGDTIIQASERPAGGAWQAPVDLSEPGAVEAGGAQVGIDSAGDAVALWSVRAATDYVIQAASLPAGGTWQAPSVISDPGHTAEEARLGVGPNGEAAAIWDLYDGANRRVQVAARTAGGTWQPPVDLSAPGEDGIQPAVAVAADGDAVALWSRSNGSTAVVEASGYDVAGPELRSLSIPASGAVGASLSFSVSPFDVWSGLGATEWSFGDGGSAVGTDVSHTFGAPGTYAVEVTGTDAVGNTSTATGTVTVPPVPPVPVAATGTARGGEARAGRVIKVKGAVAMVTLSCPGGAGCAGTLRLTVAVKDKGRAAASARSRKRPKTVTVGKASFDLAGGARRAVKVPLTRKGVALLAATGRKGFGARLLGAGVVGRRVVLRSGRRPRRR